MQVQCFQVNALLRKSWAYQRKNISSLLCVLLAPIVVATLLGILQSLVNNLLSEKGKVRILTQGDHTLQFQWCCLRTCA